MKALIPSLPKKDADLAMKFLEVRNFEGILELVKSDLYKIRKNSKEDCPSTIEGDLTELEEVLIVYMSYLEIPETNEFDFY